METVDSKYLMNELHKLMKLHVWVQVFLVWLKTHLPCEFRISTKNSKWFTHSIWSRDSRCYHTVSGTSSEPETIFGQASEDFCRQKKKKKESLPLYPPLLRIQGLLWIAPSMSSQSHFSPGTVLLGHVAFSNASLPLSLTLRNEHPQTSSSPSPHHLAALIPGCPSAGELPSVFCPGTWAQKTLRKLLESFAALSKRLKNWGQNLPQDHRSRGEDVKFKVESLSLSKHPSPAWPWYPYRAH